MYLLTADQMRRTDRLTIEKYGISAQTLMENAGRGVFEILKKRFPDLHRKVVVIVAGKGNYGGDGRVVARLLEGIGAKVTVLEVGAGPQGDATSLSAPLQDADIIVDAIFGTGISKEISGEIRPIIEAMNAQSQTAKTIVAIDIPSGLSADSGKPLGISVRADMTVTLGAPKIGLVLPEADPFVGELDVVDIGIPEGVYKELSLKTHWITQKDVKRLFVPREKATHKGTYGHLLLVGGSETKPGAILLAGRAALRTGAGLVTVALPDKAFRKFPKKFLELMYEPLPSTASGTLSHKGWKKIERLLDGKNAVAVGPGMGVNADTKAVVSQLLRHCAPPLVLDADALNCIAKEGLKERGGEGEIVMTPHPGEMARLCGTSVRAVQAERIQIAGKFASEHRVHVVLKGFRTVTAAPTGEIFINSTGNPGMATAGMGDVLTGVIGSLLAQGMKFEDAILAGVYLHGRAGDRVADRLGDRGLLASDVIDEIPLTIKELI